MDTYFFIYCLGLGFSLAADVVIFTITNPKAKSLTFWSWTFPLTITHTIFPLASFLVLWLTQFLFPSLDTFLKLFGFVVISLFILEILMELIGRKPYFSLSDLLAKYTRQSKIKSEQFILIMTVSWDALIGGIAQETKADISGWTTFEIGLSFLLIGLVVLLLTQTSLWLAPKIQTLGKKNLSHLVNTEFWGTCLSISVIYSFGIMSLWYIFSDDISELFSFLISGSIITLFFIFNKEKIKEHLD